MEWMFICCRRIKQNLRNAEVAERNALESPERKKNTIYILITGKADTLKHKQSLSKNAAEIETEFISWESDKR